MMSVVKQKFSELRILDSSNYDFSQYSRVEIGEKKLKSITLKKKVHPLRLLKLRANSS